MKNKERLIWFSIFIALILTIFINISTTFGAPLEWVAFYGRNDEINSFFSLFTPKKFTQTHFNIGTLAIDVLFIYVILSIIIKNYKLYVSKREKL